jgi:hypothetical protein
MESVFFEVRDPRLMATGIPNALCSISQ